MPLQSLFLALYFLGVAAAGARNLFGIGSACRASEWDKRPTKQRYPERITECTRPKARQVLYLFDKQGCRRCMEPTRSDECLDEWPIVVHRNIGIPNGGA